MRPLGHAWICPSPGHAGPVQQSAKSAIRSTLRLWLSLPQDAGCGLIGSVREPCFGADEQEAEGEVQGDREEHSGSAQILEVGVAQRLYRECRDSESERRPQCGLRPKHS